MKGKQGQVPPFYTQGEEWANSLSHGIGTVLSVYGFYMLLVLAFSMGDTWKLLSFSLYGFSLVFVFLSSTLYHSFQNPPVKHFFRLMDHAGIFLLIAGTYTPFTLITLNGTFGWVLCSIIWALALFGALMKVLFMEQLQGIGHWLYLGMGWLGLIALYPLFQALPMPGLLWLIAGGLLYSVGVIFYVGQKITFNHFVWHLFVIAGAMCHFLAIYLYVNPVTA